MTAATVSNPVATARTVIRVVQGRETSDGAGVNLVRVIGSGALPQIDPFLLLDAFRSDDPSDYIAGFPPHPHRGFETVTYLLAGRMRHGDNAGHAGVIESGGVQWMTAGRGIVHSEMPEQEQGLLSGFQLWVNLPAKHKMMQPRYQEFGAAAIPLEQRGDTVEVRVIAGCTEQGTRGPVQELITDVKYLDVTLHGDARFSEAVPADYTVLLHVIEGSISVDGHNIPADHLAVLGPGTQVQLQGGSERSRLLLLAGEPLGEPIARHGPFVMNTEEEIRQALRDYQAGQF